MTVGTYAATVALIWASLQVLAVLRLPQGWAFWSSLPQPAISVAVIAVCLSSMAPMSENAALVALGAPVVLLYLAFLSFSWAAHRGS